MIHFVELLKGLNLGRFLNNTRIACIGPITSKTAKELGLKVDIQPDQFTIPALANAIAQYFDPSFDKRIKS